MFVSIAGFTCLLPRFQFQPPRPHRFQAEAVSCLTHTAGILTRDRFASTRCSDGFAAEREAQNSSRQGGVSFLNPAYLRIGVAFVKRAVRFAILAREFLQRLVFVFDSEPN